MRNLKIGKELNITLSIAGILFIVTVIGNILGMRIMSSNFSSYHNGTMITSAAAMDLQRGLAEMEKYIVLLCTTESTDENQQYYQGVEEAMNAVDSAILTLQKHIIYQENRERLEKLSATLDAIEKDREKIATLGKNNQNEEALALYKTKLSSVLMDVKSITEKIGEDVDQLGKEFYNNSKTSERNAYNLSLALALISFVTIILWRRYIFRNITNFP